MTVPPVAAKQTPFAIIPAFVLEHPAVCQNRTVLHTYAALRLDANWKRREVEPSWLKINRRTGLAKATIYRDLDLLRGVGLIVWREAEQVYWLPSDPVYGGRQESTVVDDPSTVVDPTPSSTEQSSEVVPLEAVGQDRPLYLVPDDERDDLGPPNGRLRAALPRSRCADSPVPGVPDGASGPLPTSQDPVRHV